MDDESAQVLPNTGPRPRTDRRWSIIAWSLYALTVPLRAWYVFVWHNPLEFIYSDMLTYTQQAAQYFDPFYQQGVIDTIYPPGTAYFFGFLFRYSGYRAWVLTATLLLGSCAIPPLVFTIASRFFNRRTALASLLLASLYFHFVAYAGYFLSEIPFTVCVLLAFLFLTIIAQSRSPLSTAMCSPLFGLTLGAGAALKSSILLPFLLLSAMVGAIFLARRRFGHLLSTAVIAAAGLAVVLVPVSMRATRLLGGQFCLVSTNGEMVFYQGHSGRSGHFSWDDPVTGIHHEFGGPSMLQRGYTEVRANKFAAWDRAKNLEAAWTWIRENPGAAFIESVDHVYNHFTGTIPWPSSHAKESWVMMLAERLYTLFWLLPAAAFVLRIVPRWVRLEPGYAGDALLALAVVGMALVAFLTLGDPRYRVPFDGFTCILAARFYLSWWSRDVEPGLALVPVLDLPVLDVPAAAEEPPVPAPAAETTTRNDAD